MGELYDVIIIGAGPAGLTAGLYCVQAGLRALALEKETMGGQIMNVEKIENYPGFAEGISGAELGQAMVLQAMNYGLAIEFAEIQGLELGPDNKRVKTFEADYSSKAVIITGGARPKKLGVPGENEFTGKGIAYCAMCEGGQFANKVVAVAGGGDAGITGALYLTKLASKVIVIEVLPQLNARTLLQKRALENPRIEIICGSRIKAILGDTQVTELILLNTETRESTTLAVDGVLVHVGVEPQSGYLEGVVALDSQGQIVVNEMMETEVPGIFAAGDIRCGSPRQVAAAVGDGTIAAISAQKYLMELARVQ